MGGDDLSHVVKVAIEDVNNVVWRESFGKLSEAANIRKQDRQLFLLTDRERS